MEHLPCEVFQVPIEIMFSFGTTAFVIDCGKLSISFSTFKKMDKILFNRSFSPDVKKCCATLENNTGTGLDWFANLVRIALRPYFGALPLLIPSDSDTPTEGFG